MILGASTIAHRKLPLTLELLESYRAADIESLELCDYHPNFAYGDRNFAAGVTEALRDLQLHLNSIHIHLRNRDPSCDLASTDAAQHERSVAAHRQTVDFAHSLGGCILVTHDIDIPAPDEPNSESRLAAFVDGVRAVAGYAEDKGVRLALENIPRGFTNAPDRHVELIERIGCVNVGAVIDTGHRNLGGNPAAALRAGGRHLITLHLHDNHGAKDEHLLPGRGAIDWPDITQALRDVAYPGVFMYELNRPEDLSDLPANAAWIQAQ